MNFIPRKEKVVKKPKGQVAGDTTNTYVQDALSGKYGGVVQGIAQRNTGVNMDIPGSLDTPGGQDYSSTIPLGSDGKPAQTLQDVMSRRSSSRTTPASMSAGTSKTNRTPSLGGKTANSAGSYYGSAGTNTMGLSFDSAGNRILGTLGGKNVIGGRVDRTAGVPVDPFTQMLQNMQGNSLESTYKQLAKERQGQIDAIELSAKQAVNAEQATGAQDLARQRSMNLRSGLGGSDFGAANKSEIRTRTKENIAGIEANRDIAYGNAINKIEELATARFNAQQTANQNNFSNMMDVQEYQDKQTEKMKTDALESLKTLAQGDPTLDMAKIQLVDPELYESIKTGLNKSDFELDLLFKQNSGRTSEYTWKGNNLVAINKDAQGQMIDYKTYDAEELGIPAGVDVGVFDDGSGQTYWYDKSEKVEKGKAPTFTPIGEAKSTDNGFTPYQTFQATQALKKNTQTMTAASNELKRQVGNMDTAWNRLEKGETTDLNATSQAIITTFNKILDPTSVVRESEYDRTPTGQALIDRIEGKMNSVVAGGPGLTKESLKELVDLGRAFAKGAQESIDMKNASAREEAQFFGLNPDFVIPGSGGSQGDYADFDSYVDFYLRVNPQAGEDEILNAYEKEGGGFSQVGGDTNTAMNRPQRNNNPFNIKASENTKSYSGVAGTDPIPATDGGKFLVFNSPEAGLKAGERLLKTEGYRGLTVDQAMRRWSNNGYGGEIASQIKGKKVDQLTAQEMQTLLKAMANREGYYA